MQKSLHVSQILTRLVVAGRIPAELGHLIARLPFAWHLLCHELDLRDVI
jgi:hypothetical protein